MASRQTAFLLLILAGFSAAACSGDSERKIKLTEDKSDAGTNVQTVSSVLQVDSATQHSLAILRLENRTGDASLDWLRRGLADMLEAELTQALYINVVPSNKLYEKLEQTGADGATQDGLSAALSAASAVRVSSLLSGEFSYDRGQLNIDVTLYAVATGQILLSERVSGEGMERVFRMVDELAQRLRDNLRGDLDASPALAKVSLTDMTHSVDAFKCYSEALESIDRVQLKKAVEWLTKAIRLDTTFAAAHLKLALLRFKTGEPEQAEVLLKSARRHAHKLAEPDKIMLKIFEAEFAGDAGKLVEGMHDLLKLEPYDTDTRLQLANNLRKFCQYDRAIEQYDMILEMEPDRVAAYSELAQLYIDRGDIKEALWYAKKYEALQPDEPGPYFVKGRILKQAGRFEESIEQLKRALEKRADFQKAARELAESYAELGKKELAIKFARKWAMHEPTPFLRADAQAELAKMYWRFGDYSAAMRAVDSAMQAWPTHAQAALAGGEIAKSLGDRKAEQKLYRRFLGAFEQKEPGDLDNYQLSNLLEFCTETDVSVERKIEVLEKFASAEKRPLQRQFYDMHLGILHLRQKNYGRANDYFQSNTESYLNLLMHFPHIGWSSAWKYTVEAIRLQPPQEQYDLSMFDEMLKSATAAGRTDLEVVSGFFIAQYYGKYQNRSKLESVYKRYGAALEDRWRLIGPFENPGFHHAFPPEREIEPEMTYESRSGKLAWHSAEDGASDGYVDLRTAVGGAGWATAYAAVVVNVPEKRKVQIRLSTNEGAKLWINDELAWQVYRRKEVPLDHDIVAVVLHPGDNKMLLKVNNSSGDWGFYFRVTDENGRGYPDLSFTAIDDAAFAGR